MNPLDMNRICRLAPYKVWTDNGIDYYIETNRGQIFVIGFMDDYSIWPTGAYQFTITNRNNQPSPLDQKLRETFVKFITYCQSTNSKPLILAKCFVLYLTQHLCIGNRINIIFPITRKGIPQ
jgi:hypothetical protein